MEAKIYTKNIPIGVVNLEVGDYTMGGLYGLFTPNEYYLEEIQKQVRNFNEEINKDFQIWNSFDFKVELVNGYILNPIGGITIEDYNEMFGESIQIELVGVACDIIDGYFNVK